MRTKVLHHFHGQPVELSSLNRLLVLSVGAGLSALSEESGSVGNPYAYADFGGKGLGMWDYLGAMLVCMERGIDMADHASRSLVPLDHAVRRNPLTARGTLPAVASGDPAAAAGLSPPDGSATPEGSAT